MPLSISNPKERRLLLIDQMSKLSELSIDCKECNGECCTFVANSMQITPLEAVDLYTYCKDNFDRVELLASLKNCIKEFRLDKMIPTNNRCFMRKSYTCPFYLRKKLGCSIPNEYKPYGCLAFNPTNVKSKEGQGCYSQIELLEKRELQFKEIEQNTNSSIKRELKLWWDKLPVPNALIDIYENFAKDEITGVTILK
ncbi:MAG: hypothetical protein ACOCUH_01620 [Bacteriovoracia bacterium]